MHEVGDLNWDQLGQIMDWRKVYTDGGDDNKYVHVGRLYMGHDVSGYYDENGHPTRRWHQVDQAFAVLKERARKAQKAEEVRPVMQTKHPGDPPDSKKAPKESSTAGSGSSRGGDRNGDHGLGTQYPSCKMTWKASSGGKVQCNDVSLVPRKGQLAWDSDVRCACYPKVFAAEHTDRLHIYPGCDQDASICTF